MRLLNEFTAKPLFCLVLFSSAVAVGLSGDAGAQDAPVPSQASHHSPSGPNRYIVPTAKAVEFYSRRVEARPNDYLSYIVLGRLHLRQARESDDHREFHRAEQAFRRALELNASNPTATSYLAESLMAQHRFREARAAAQEVLDQKPGSSLALATLGDAHLELGNYDEAIEANGRLQDLLGPLPAVAARQARLSELQGDSEQAIRLLKQAKTELEDAAAAKDQLSWYEWRLGRLSFDCGQLEQASSHFLASLQHVPNSARALAGLAQVRAAQGKIDESRGLYKRAIASSPEPPFLAALGDLVAHQGQHQEAELLYDQADAGMKAEAQFAAAAHYREVAMFYANHDRKLPTALELAQSDWEIRQDIYACDTLAWALFKNHQYEEAAKFSENSRRLGTRDAQLYYHGGLICARLGQRKQAENLLKTALAINPHFSITGAEVIRNELAALATQPGD